MNAASGDVGETPKHISEFKAVKLKSCCVKPVDDYPPGCHTSSMVITKDRQWLLVDSSGDVIKLFSNDMEFLTSIDLLADGAYQMAVVNDQEAVVTTGKKKLVTLDISDALRGQLSIKCTTELHFTVLGITTYKDKLVVTSYRQLVEPGSVKLIDQTGQ